MGAKLKFDFEDEQNLLFVEGMARDGLDDKQIAEKLGYNETYFSTMKGQKEKLAKALKKGRSPLSFHVENSLYLRAIGRVKVKSVTRRWIEDENGNQTDKQIIQEVESELPPDVGAAAFWLKNQKSEVWNKQPIRIDTTTNGKDIAPARVLTKQEIIKYFNDLEKEY